MAVTQNVMTHHNFTDVWRSTRSERPKFAQKFLEDLKGQVLVRQCRTRSYIKGLWNWTKKTSLRWAKDIVNSQCLCLSVLLPVPAHHRLVPLRRLPLLTSRIVTKLRSKSDDSPAQEVEVEIEGTQLLDPRRRRPTNPKEAHDYLRSMFVIVTNTQELCQKTFLTPLNRLTVLNI